MVNFPARGIGARSVEQLQDAAKAAEAACSPPIPRLAGEAAPSLAGFAALIEALKAGRSTCRCRNWSSTWSNSRACARHYATEKEGQDRLANLDELVNAAANFVAEEGVMAPRANCRRPDLSWRMPRWKPASTRPARATTPCN